MNAPQPGLEFSHPGTIALRMLGLIAVFVALGPPVGWLTLMISLLGGELLYPTAPFSKVASNAAFMFPIGAAASYPVGAPFALAAGLLVGIGRLLLKSFGPFHAAGAGLAIALALMSLSKSDPAFGGQKLLFVSIILIFVVPSLVCWYATRNFRLR